MKHLWIENRFFEYAIGFVLVLLIILLLSHTSFIIAPFFNYIAAVFFPLLLSAILYYVLRPIVRWMTMHHIPRVIAIFSTYLIILIVMILIFSLLGPMLVQQISTFTLATTNLLEHIKGKTEGLVAGLPIDIGQIKELIASFLIKLNDLITNNIVETVSTVTRFAVTLVITPFILYYFLKDDRHLYTAFIRNISPTYRLRVRKILTDADMTLSTFIRGQLLVSCILGGLLFIGYELIGLDNAFILAVFAMGAVTIPFFGTFIALIPALMVGLSQSPFMATKAVFVVLVGVALESNLIAPQIMSQRLHIHPLTVMLLLLASGSLYGILGLFLATPVYAVLKVVFKHAYEIYSVQKTVPKIDIKWKKPEI